MTKTIKRTVLRIFFVGEVVIFFLFFFFGSQGITYLWHLQRENQKLEHNVITLHQEVVALRDEIDTWNTHPFYKEKIARENLQMARPGEYIYYLSQK